MSRQVKQLALLSLFALVCMAVGMGLSWRWVAQAQEEMPVMVASKGMEALPPIAEVAEKLNPTVVSIINTSFVKNRARGEGDSPFGDEFYNWFFGPQRPGGRRPQDEEQRIQAGGSGVLISPDGEILTNYHVIEGIKGGESSIEVKTSNDRTYRATVLGRDKELDIALIKIDARHMPFARLGDSDAIKVGEWVVAIGNPLGLDHTVTQGIISAKGRQISGPGLESFLQTDAAINRGNSGGPLLNLRGEVIGINTAIRPDGQNIGFAVPVNKITQVLRDLRSGRPVSRGFLGVGTKDLDNEFREYLGIQEGAVVSEVVRGGPRGQVRHPPPGRDHRRGRGPASATAATWWPPSPATGPATRSGSPCSGTASTRSSRPCWATARPCCRPRARRPDPAPRPRRAAARTAGPWTWRRPTGSPWRP